MELSSILGLIEIALEVFQDQTKDRSKKHNGIIIDPWTD